MSQLRSLSSTLKCSKCPGRTTSPRGGQLLDDGQDNAQVIASSVSTRFGHKWKEGWWLEEFNLEVMRAAAVYPEGTCGPEALFLHDNRSPSTMVTSGSAIVSHRTSRTGERSHEMMLDAVSHVRRMGTFSTRSLPYSSIHLAISCILYQSIILG